MLYNLLADLVLITHLLFIVFAVMGGILILRWRKLAWVHLPAVAWAVIVELCGWICPLTPLEIWLRSQGGGTVYSTDFVAHYLLPVIYPDYLTRTIQILLGLAVLLINLMIYGYLVQQGRRKSARPDPRQR